MAAWLAGKAAAVHRDRACERARLFAEDLFHRLALGELVDEFVEVADLAHHRLLNLLHADAAYDVVDQKARRVHLRRVREEILKACLLRKLGFQRGLAVAGEPAEDLADLGPGAALLLRLGNIRGIDARDGQSYRVIAKRGASTWRISSPSLRYRRACPPSHSCDQRMPARENPQMASVAAALR